MTAMLTCSMAPELKKSHPALEIALSSFVDVMNEFPPEDIVAILQAITRSLSHTVQPSGPSAIGEMHDDSREPRVSFEVLLRQFERRHELLAGALTTPAVAKRLGTSRQTAYGLARNGSLLAERDRGAWRFPVWQFDANQQSGIVAGLTEVLDALNIVPMRQMNWLVSPHALLDNSTPIDMMRSGDIGTVVRLAQQVGATSV